jgi:hypothetical protein
MNLFQAIFVPVCAAIGTLVLIRAARGQLAARQGLAWGTIWSLAAVLIAFPKAASVAARWLGIGRGSDLVFYAAVLAGVAACLYFYQRFRRLEVLCTELLRRESLRHAERGPAAAEERTACEREEAAAR